MRIGIDGRVLSKPNPTGVTRYARKLLSRLAVDADCVVFGCTPAESGLGSRARENVEWIDRSVPPEGGLRGHLWGQTVLPRLVRRYDVDLFHVPAGVPPIAAPVPVVTTIHDVSPIAHPEWFSRRYAWFYRLMTPLSIRSSDRLVAVSEFTADEIADRYRTARAKTTVVHNGVTEPHSGSAPDCALSPGEFHLFVGARTPRKNFDGLLRGYECYRSIADDPLDLALVGPDRNIFGETPLLDTTGIRDLGYVSEPELGWLYRNAKSFLYPSLYEGFGFPVLEAMSVGTPVVTSGRGATAEVADDAAVLVDPTDPNDIARGIQQAECTAADLAQRGCRRAAAFDWETTATETRSVYREVLDA